MNQETINALDILRDAAQNFLDDQKVSAARIVETEQNSRPARLISFDFYGTSERAQELIDINQDVNVSYFQGIVKVLTNDNS